MHALRSTRTLFTAGCQFALKPSIFVPEDVFEERASKFIQLNRVNDNVFSSNHLFTSRQGSPRSAYGGLIFSQALAAAENTVDSKLKPNAVHSFFINGVDISLPIEYHVRRVRDGRSFTNRTIDAIQNGVTAFIMQASFHKEETASFLHQRPMPSVPHWSQLSSISDIMPIVLQKLENGEIQIPKPTERRLREYDLRAHAEDDLFEIRPTNPRLRYQLEPPTDDLRTYQWFRTKGDISTDDDKFHRFLISYNTDQQVCETGFRPHFWNNTDATMFSTLDHNVWIHHPLTRADQWLLFETKSSIAHGGRCFANGRVWTEDGKMVLSCSQEFLIRGKDGVSQL